MTVQTIGRYDIMYAIGAGSHGTVMCAYDTQLQRKVALKTLKASSSGALKTQEAWQEAQALARLNHPNIVSIYEVFENQNTIYLVTEFVAGETLSTLLSQGALEFADVISLSMKLVSGLASVHSKGLVHADIKPDNVMIREDGEPVVVDFGIARSTVADDGTMTLDDNSTQAISKIEGTLAYMAPEVIRGETPTAQSDIFSLGTMIYEMLSGHHVFQQKTQAATVHLQFDQPHDGT